jgi:hypothetical protein
MKSFIQQNQKKVIGVLSGFDRLIFKGTLQYLQHTPGMMDFLYSNDILLKDFGPFAEKITKELREASKSEAIMQGRPIKYISSSTARKDFIAKEIAKADGIEEGLICILTCVEPCKSFEIYKNRELKIITIERRDRKCLHLYHYWMDPDFGFMHGRIQTWFPFTIRVYINGREWLSRELKKRNINYIKKENCFIKIDDVEEAQNIMNEQLKTNWPEVLQNIANKLNPIHDKIFSAFNIDYFWATYQSEWATDIMFSRQRYLDKIYPQLIRGAIISFSTIDVMRFLGKRTRGHGFHGEVVSTLHNRPEGIRIKHQVKKNSVKMYNKQGQILRVETTINDPRDFKVLRHKQGNEHGEKEWLKMRKGIADLYARAQVSDASNKRYIEALASFDTSKTIAELVSPICKANKLNNKRVRALRPWEEKDKLLLKTVNNGDYILAGFRNRDLFAVFYPNTKKISQIQKKQRKARITRQIRILRGHGIVKKVPHSHRYLVTSKGRRIISAILAYIQISLEMVNNIQMMEGCS